MLGSIFVKIQSLLQPSMLRIVAYKQAAFASPHDMTGGSLHSLPFPFLACTVGSAQASRAQGGAHPQQCSMACRRELAGTRTTLGHTTESLELVPCQDFIGPAGTRAPNAQPFHVHVHPLVSAGVAGLRNVAAAFPHLSLV